MKILVGQNSKRRSLVPFLIGLILFGGTGLLFSGCGSEKPAGTQVGMVDAVNPDRSILTIMQPEIDLMMGQYNRLTEPEYHYKYTSADVVSFPLQPGKYIYYLVVEAEVTNSSRSIVYSSYRVYSELNLQGKILFFKGDNFQQSCCSTTCSDCKLIYYHNGSYGCDCSEDPSNQHSDCQYNKSRVLTKKQQKSDII